MDGLRQVGDITSDVMAPAHVMRGFIARSVIEQNFHQPPSHWKM